MSAGPTPFMRWLRLERIEADQFDALMRAIPVVAFMSTVGAAVCYAGYRSIPFAGNMALWLVLFVAVSLARIVGSLLHRRGVRRTDHRLWLHWTFGCTLLNALQWGSAAIVAPPAAGAEAESLLHICMSMVAMGAAVHLSAYIRVLAAYVACVLVPLVARDLVIGGAHHWLLAFTTLMIGAYALLIGNKQSAMLLETLAQRRRNAELAEALRVENQRSEAARGAAEEASAAKSRFLAAANHDLRQPLNAMALLAQTLHDGRADVGEVSGHLLECVDGMAQVVDDLLDITRLDVGHVASQTSVFALDALLREACQPYRALARGKGLPLEVRCEGAPVVLGDRALLARVLANLLSNAVRYTRDGLVRVAVDPIEGSDPPRLRLRVQDTGIGIATEHLPRIFEEFYQVGNPERDRRLGLGLGLATVKRLSDLLDLGVQVCSRLGEGSEFSLSLPLASPGQVAGMHRGPCAPEAPLPAAQRVLVIEDDADSRRALLSLLRAWDCDARAVAATPEALALLHQGFVPDALVVDLRLADGRSGLDAIDALRQACARAQLAAVILTGDVGSASMQAAQARGLAVMVKPVRPAQLRAFLAQASVAA